MPERFISPAAPPTPREREVTEILIEECSEVQKRGTKLLRFGPKEIQQGRSYDNAYRLGLEVGDLLEVVEMAVTEGLIPMEAIERGRADKRGQLKYYMQTDPPPSDSVQSEESPK